MLGISKVCSKQSVEAAIVLITITPRTVINYFETPYCIVLLSSCFISSGFRHLITLAGTPPTTQLAGTSFTTTAFAAIVTLSPISTPPQYAGMGAKCHIVSNDGILIVIKAARCSHHHPWTKEYILSTSFGIKRNTAKMGDTETLW